jgi:hypothetical protein
VENEKPLLAAFDYEADVPADAVLSVADAIRSIHQLAPLTEEQKLQRRIDHEIFRDEQAWASEQRRLEREHRRAEAEAVARQEAAIERAEANRKARLERQEQISRQTRDREILDLRLQAAQQRGWISNVENAARNAVALRQQQALLADVERHFNPPSPPPAPEVIHVEAVEGSDQLGTSDFNPKLWMQKPRSWW